MNSEDYEQKKLEFKKKMLAELFKTKKALVNYENAIFDYTFDRAYALGKVADLITQTEIDQAAEDYVSFEKGGKCYPSYIVERACCRAFKDGANFALGKHPSY